MCVHATIEPLAWESEFFALDSAKLSFSSSAPALAEADLAAYALVQAKVPAQHLALADGLADLGFRLVEGEVDLVLALEHDHVVEPGFVAQTSRLAAEADIPALRTAAAQAFTVSRFRTPGINLMTAAGFMLCGSKRPFWAPSIISACWRWTNRGGQRDLSACVTLAARKCVSACWRLSPAYQAGALALG